MTKLEVVPLIIDRFLLKKSYVTLGIFQELPLNPTKTEWDLTNGPLSKLVELLDTQVFLGSVQ